MAKKSKTYTRAIVLKLYATQSKQQALEALVRRYRKAVNRYLQIFEIKPGKLDKETLARVECKLSQRYKSNALKQALGIWKGCEKTKNKLPKFKGFPILDHKFVSIQEGKNSFNIWLRLSTLKAFKKVLLPTKSHKQLERWLAKGKLIQGCELHKNKVIVWVKVEKQDWKTGKTLGIDLGINKLIATSENQFFGKDMKKYIDAILKTKQGSRGRKRALRARDLYINQVINQLPWETLSVLIYENLTNIKKGKKKNRSRCFRVKQKHWTVSQAVSRILQKCEENRVRPIYVNPKNTSRTCPACGDVSASNRTNEDFCCLTCGYKQDADFVGATNILSRGSDWLGSQSPLTRETCNI